VLNDEDVVALFKQGLGNESARGDASPGSAGGQGGRRSLKAQLSNASEDDMSSFAGGLPASAPQNAIVASSSSSTPALSLVKAPATWDEDSRLFWVDTGVNAYDIPDGSTWQQEFKLALHKSETPKEDTGNTSSQPSSPGLRPKGQRRLVYQSSDPSKLERRIMHNSVLQKMSVKAGVPLQVQDRNLALFRFGSQVFAVDRSCPHQGGNLAEGEIGDIEDMVEGRKCYITCPVHKFQFDLSTGKVLHGKCPPLPTYKVRLRSIDEASKVTTVDVGFESLASHYFDEFEADDF